MGIIITIIIIILRLGLSVGSAQTILTSVFHRPQECALSQWVFPSSPKLYVFVCSYWEWAQETCECWANTLPLKYNSGFGFVL